MTLTARQVARRWGARANVIIGAADGGTNESSCSMRGGSSVRTFVAPRSRMSMEACSRWVRRAGVQRTNATSFLAARARAKRDEGLCIRRRAARFRCRVLVVDISLRDETQSETASFGHPHAAWLGRIHRGPPLAVVPRISYVGDVRNTFDRKPSAAHFGLHPTGGSWRPSPCDLAIPLYPASLGLQH